MDHDEHKGNRHGPAVMLALLLSFLLGAGPAAVWSDVRPANFKPLEPAKATALVRTVRRSSDDQADPSDPTLDSGGVLPSSETSLPAHPRPTVAASRLASFFAGDRPTPFRARAPPAA